MEREGNLRNSKEVFPNFVNEAAKHAEQSMRELFSRAKDLGVEIETLPYEAEYMLGELRRILPQRYELVIQRLRQEGLRPSDLSKPVLIDRVLGIDAIIGFEGKKIAVDVTTGKSTVVINKQTKFLEMEALYRQLGIDYAVVLKIEEDVTDDLILDFFSKLEDMLAMVDTFCVVIKYPSPEGEGFHGPTRAALRRANKNIKI